jgi:hypothetical protein
VEKRIVTITCDTPGCIMQFTTEDVPSSSFRTARRQAAAQGWTWLRSPSDGVYADTCPVHVLLAAQDSRDMAAS